MQPFVGRAHEKNLLDRILKGNDLEFLALYGRRRVGKTFLIRESFQRRVRFELTGILDAPLDLQLSSEITMDELF